MKRRILCMTIALIMLFGMVQTAAAFDTSADTQMLWLVNVDHPLDKNFVPADLVVLDSSIYQNPNAKYMRETPAKALKLMLEGVEAAGYGKLTARSGYRSYATQSSMFSSRLQTRLQTMTYQQAYDATKMYTAIPGTSEHQAGFSQDLSDIYSALNNDFGDTKAAAWLRDNSWRYGFILRYTKEKIPYTKIADEPWHFRYVGTVHAQLIYENGWCYEEYIEYLHKNKYIALDTPGNYIYEVFWTDDTSMEFENITEISSDNAGGWIITTCSPKDILAKIKGNWAEQSFISLLNGQEFAYPYVINPSAAITRAEFAMLYDLLGDYLYQNKDMTREIADFADVPQAAYYYDAVMRMAKARVMNGTSTTQFSPSNLITREATATAIANIINDNTIKIISYKDLSSISGWAFQSIQKVTYQGLMIGVDGKFNPKGNLTWAEAATIIHRLKTYLAKNQPLKNTEEEKSTEQTLPAEENVTENTTNEDTNTAENPADEEAKDEDTAAESDVPAANEAGITEVLPPGISAPQTDN